MLYQGKVVLITGASSGIGEALALAMAHEGADLVLTARREDRLADLARRIEALGRRALPLAVDVTADGAQERAVEQAVAKFGRLDVAIANAGFGVVGQAAQLTLDDYRRQLETNFFGVLRTFYAALPQLKANRGQFAAVGSVSGHVPTPDTSAYVTSKFALRGFMESIVEELAPEGVGVTLISPGFVESEIRQVDNTGIRRDGAAEPVPAWLLVPAATAAREMVHGLAARRREVIVTGHGKVLVFLYRHAPWLLRLVTRHASGKKRRAFNQ